MSSSPLFDLQIEDLAIGVDQDPVPVSNERYRPSVDRFRSDVADAVPVGPTREPSVGHECAVGPPSRPFHRTGHREHLAHPRAALRPLVADDDDCARFDGALENRFERGLLPVEHPGGAVEPRVLVEARDLHNRALLVRACP